MVKLDEIPKGAIVPDVEACDGSEVKRTFYGLTPIQAWDRAGRWLAGQERGSSGHVE